MKKRKGISAIVFIKERNNFKFLLLRRKLNWVGWEFLKGGRKKGENEKECLKREIKEEIGMKNFSFKKTPFFHEFRYSRPYKKDKIRWDSAKNRIYVVRIFSNKIKLDKNEHSSFKWFSKKDVLKKLTWKDYKILFEKIMNSKNYFNI